jgi:peptidylprolyl isomerase
MSAANRERRRQNREARVEAEHHAVLRARRRRWIVAGVALAVALIVAIVLVRPGGDDDNEVAAEETPTTTSKPCVAFSDTLPEGAPDVPVNVGPAPTQLISEDLVVGTGEEVQPGASVVAHYVGVSCSTGKIFDSSYSRGEPTPFSLNEVIKGWTDGIPGMKVGGRRLLGIPSDQAYGAAGREGIAPDEALWFVVEITGVAPQ